METNASKVEITDPGNAIVFDTSSGISLEEQKEILAGINSITDRHSLAHGVSDTKAKKKGFFFPLFVNLGALIIVGAGLYALSVINIQDEQEIRLQSAGMGLTERLLIRELREGANPAADELMRLSDERERAARIESLIGGFFTRVNSQIEGGRFNEASATLLEMKDFLDTPVYRNIRSLEAGRQSYMIAINALELSVEEAIKLREEAAVGGITVLGEALAELNTRYAALEEENASLILSRDEQIASLTTRRDEQIASLNSRRDEQIAEINAELALLQARNINQQEMLNRWGEDIAGLRNERDDKDRQILTLRASLAEQIAQREELQRQHNDLQARLDAAMRLFQTD